MESVELTEPPEMLMVVPPFAARPLPVMPKPAALMSPPFMLNVEPLPATKTP